MALPPLPAIPPISVTPETSAATSGANAAGGASPAGGGDFLSQLGQAVDSLQQTQTAANTQALSVANGTGNISDYMVAAEQASLATQLTTTFTDKATAAFNMIMEMTV